MTTLKKFYKRDLVIEAYQTQKRREVHTCIGLVTALPGDWILRDMQGNKGVCPPDVFQRLYVDCEQQKEAA